MFSFTSAVWKVSKLIIKKSCDIKCANSKGFKNKLPKFDDFWVDFYLYFCPLQYIFYKMIFMNKIMSWGALQMQRPTNRICDLRMLYSRAENTWRLMDRTFTIKTSVPDKINSPKSISPQYYRRACFKTNDKSNHCQFFYSCPKATGSFSPKQIKKKCNYVNVGIFYHNKKAKTKTEIWHCLHASLILV